MNMALPGAPPQIDAKVIAAGETALRAYLRDYPKGLYAASARGLLRRVYWLGGRDDKLGAEYAALFAQPASVAVSMAARWRTRSTTSCCRG